MSEQNHASLDNEQEKINPKIEDEILELLDGDLKETALEFAAYLRENNMMPRQWFGPTYWRIPYGKDYLCSIVIHGMLIDLCHLNNKTYFEKCDSTQREFLSPWPV